MDYHRPEIGGGRGFWALVAVLILAPLYKGGNHPLVLLSLEIVALGLVALVIGRPVFRFHLPPVLLACIAVLLFAPLLQLLPLWDGFWGILPGREEYARGLRAINYGELFSGLRPGSLVPFETLSSWLALLPPVAVFLVAMNLHARQLQTLVIVFLSMAVLQALLGLIQFGGGGGGDSPFYPGNSHMAGSAAGTYVSRNHLAGMLEMALPLGLALLMAAIEGYRQRPSRRDLGTRDPRRTLANPVSPRGNQAVFFGAMTIAILLGLIVTRSQTGVSLAMVGIVLCLGVFSRRLGGNDVHGIAGTFTTVGIGLAVLIGLALVLERFALSDSLGEARWWLFSGTLGAIGEFFPLGSGLGTFQEVFPRFQPVGLVTDKIANYAHNDYLEWTMEGGLMALLVLIFLLACYLRQWLQVWIGGIWSTFRFVQVGAGIAVLLMMLHGFVGFNLHIPANAVYFALLAAVFFHPGDLAESEPSSDKGPERGVVEKRRLVPQTIPPENTVNPFDVP